jgi:hypothetical protein
MSACLRSLVPSLAPALTLVAFALVGPGADAQAQRLRSAPPPRETVRMDMATGTITRGPTVAARAIGTVSDFPNLDFPFPGFIGVDTGNGVLEWFNDGIKGTSDNRSDLVTAFVVAYATVKRDVALGGPGGSVKLGFYEGYTRHGAPNGTPNGTAVAVFTLTGLPGNSASSTFLGGSFSSYLLEVQTQDLVSFADGPIGYSWKFLDSGTDGLFAGTVPYLAHASTCIDDPSGPYAGPPDALGQVAYDCCSPRPADAYLNGTFREVFTFLPYCFPFSMAVDIREVSDLAATATAFTGDGVNADVLVPAPAIVGQSWSPQVTLGHGHGTGGIALLSIRTRAVNGASIVSPIGGRTTEFLLAGPLLGTLRLAHDGAATLPVSVPVPAQLALVSVPWAAQATVAGGGFLDFSTAVSGFTGTE